MIAVGAHISNAQRSVRRNLAFDFQRVGENRGSIRIGLNAARRDQSDTGRIADRALHISEWNVLEGLSCIERSNLVQAIIEIVEQSAIDAESGMDYGLACTEGIPGYSQARLRQKFRAISGEY